MKCKHGQNGAYEKLLRPNCPDSPECYEFELYTNADRIRAMSDEELAVFLESSRGCPSDDDCEYGVHATPENCIKHWATWLQQPAKEGI